MPIFKNNFQKIFWNKYFFVLYRLTQNDFDIWYIARKFSENLRCDKILIIGRLHFFDLSYEWVPLIASFFSSSTLAGCALCTSLSQAWVNDFKIFLKLNICVCMSQPWSQYNSLALEGRALERWINQQKDDRAKYICQFIFKRSQVPVEIDNTHQ